MFFMLNKCDFETSIVILLLFCFNRSKSICLGHGYGIFHTQYPAVLYTEGFVTVCVEIPFWASEMWSFHREKKSTETSL